MTTGKLVIRGRETLPIIQGGMGVGVSGLPLVLAVAACGGIGVLSSAWMQWLYFLETGKRASLYDAVYYFVRRAKDESGGKPIGLNVMVKLQGFEETIRAAVDAGVDYLFLGAGVSWNAPEIVGTENVALIPIVSSARAAITIAKRWFLRYKRLPDGFVLEGPLAGGHLGFDPKQVHDPNYQLIKLLPELLDVAKGCGNVPVIVAGGLKNHQDIEYWKGQGASGFQFGTLFLLTHESDAMQSMKQRVAECTTADIVIAHPNLGLRGSPAGYPFRVLKDSPGLTKIPREDQCRGCPIFKKCEEGKGCLALDKPEQAFCIGRGLRGVIHPGMEEDAVITCGQVAAEIFDIVSVKERFAQLGITIL